MGSSAVWEYAPLHLVYSAHTRHHGFPRRRQIAFSSDGRWLGGVHYSKAGYEGYIYTMDSHWPPTRIAVMNDTLDQASLKACGCVDFVHSVAFSPDGHHR